MTSFRNRTTTALASLAALGLWGCPQTPGTGTGPTAANAAGCSPSAAQDGNGLSLDCTLTASRGEQLLDPLDDSNTQCSPLTNDLANNEPRDARLHALFGQSITAAYRLVIGRGGDDTPSRIRADIDITSGNYTGSTAKVRPDCTHPTPGTAVSSSFMGSHVALVDRLQIPACVFASRYTVGNSTVTMGSASPNLEPLIRSRLAQSIRDEADLAVARQANFMFKNLANLPDDLVGRSGRCASGYEEYRDGM